MKTPPYKIETLANETRQVYYRLLHPCEMLGYPDIWHCGMYRFVKITSDEIVALHLSQEATNTDSA